MKRIIATKLDGSAFTVQTSAYAAGDVIGEKFILPNVPFTGYVHQIFVIDKNGQKLDIDVALFNQNFTGATDNAAFVITSSEEDRLLMPLLSLNTHVDVDANVSTSASTIASRSYQLESGNQNLYGQLIARTSITYTSTDALIVVALVLEEGYN
jgi:hypothetical protein